MKVQTWLTLLALLAALFWQAGCATPTPDPLAGWNFSFSQDPADLPKAMRDDYQIYIQKLPPNVRYFVQDYNIRLFENGTGQHAVKIEIPLNGAYSEHVLFYDKDNKRIKVIICSGGRYAS